MDRNPKPKTQREKFEDAARELETDDREEAFDRALRKVARPRPPAPNETVEKPPLNRRRDE